MSYVYYPEKSKSHVYTVAQHTIKWYNHLNRTRIGLELLLVPITSPFLHLSVSSSTAWEFLLQLSKLSLLKSTNLQKTRHCTYVTDKCSKTKFHNSQPMNKIPICMLCNECAANYTNTQVSGLSQKGTCTRRPSIYSGGGGWAIHNWLTFWISSQPWVPPQWSFVVASLVSSQSRSLEDHLPHDQPM